ncbi:MAG TPA: (d)CMP kinase [Phnomibacter sp.]|nr:(d)CMP kinase [Phnomibacter sp.]
MGDIIVTIDGFSACGKSTLAKLLAARLNYCYIDSGAMYRAITLYFLRNQVNWNNQQEVVNALAHIDLSFELNPETRQSEMYLNGENVEYLIRELAVAEKVSDVAVIKEVREFAVAAQQKLGEQKAIVMDGRDIGTTVFPNAELKIFLVADTAVRVARRWKELSEKNPAITEEEVKANLEKRDYIDSHREISPLRKADDAIILDNSDCTLPETVDRAYALVKAKLDSLNA